MAQGRGESSGWHQVLGGIRSGLHACGSRVCYSVGVGGGEDRGQRGGCACFCRRDERLEEEEEEGEGYRREGRTLHATPGSRQL